MEGRADILRISASDAQDRLDGCGAYGALKIRPNLKAASWTRRFDNSQPFLLGMVREICTRLHSNPRVDTWEGLDHEIDAELQAYALHPGSRAYARHAIENYLDAHEVGGADIDPLTFRLFDPQVAVGPGRTLTVWSPVYESGTGIREVRRLRFGGVRPPGETPDRWTAVAARVAALTSPVGDIGRIRVTEIGLGDGSFQVLFDGTPESTLPLYEGIALASLRTIDTARTMTPGHSCQDCKIAGCCGAIEEFDGFLGQESPGEGTRSVSARDIEAYGTCAARWHLDMACHLPKERFTGAGSRRGSLIHHWIATAHVRSRRCVPSDVGDFGDPNSFTSTLTADEYAEVSPYLRQHLATCPLGEGIRLIATESPLYGYDRSADVVIASEPDALYTDADGCFVIRETKTTNQRLPRDDREAFERYLAVPWLLNLLGTGYRGPHRAESARLELEVLSRDESRLFTWDLRDGAALSAARAAVHLRSAAWHRDTTWAASPGEQCAWCPVRRWCPDARAGADED
ncbi:PD-(D/E)XK nuclease family protein [Streptomyces sp. NPDC058623]|uniref:PD-(D/E)XK nuclease family protein n=1 Tax=Streptomyces sp. NPDC058623 TaxID=3346563 RepID=UPI0036480194